MLNQPTFLPPFFPPPSPCPVGPVRTSSSYPLCAVQRAGALPSLQGAEALLSEPPSESEGAAVGRERVLCQASRQSPAAEVSACRPVRTGGAGTMQPGACHGLCGAVVRKYAFTVHLAF